jgi:hypothetical protein
LDKNPYLDKEYFTKSRITAIYCTVEVTTRKTIQDYEISDKDWMKIEPLLPLPKPKKKSGRPRKDNKRIFSGIY